jgi:succinylglutamate desuccinylase
VTNSATGLPNIYAVELTPPDLSGYAAGNTGVPYIWTFDSGQPGPHVALSAIVHGNEPCGAIALDWLMTMEARPLSGKLSLAFVNIAAYEAFDPEEPDATRWVEEDFNRLWGPGVLDDPDRKVTPEVERARQIRPWLSTVDLLLDIHSMQHKTEALIIAGPSGKGRVLGREIGRPGIVVTDKGHAEGARMRDFGDFSDQASPRNAALVECGQHWEAESAEIAKDCVTGFLRTAGIMDPEFGAERMATRPEAPPQRFYEVTGPVTIQTGNFTFAENWRGFEHLAQGTLIGHDGETPIHAPHDPTVLIMPSRRLWPGKTAVRLARPIEG